MTKVRSEIEGAGAADLVALLLDASRNYIGQRRGAEAEACADRALGVLATLEPGADRATALVLLGSAKEVQGDLEGAESAWQEARRLQEATSNHLGAAETYYHLASLRRARGDLREARVFLLTSLQFSASAPPGAIRARALEDLCPVERRLGDPEGAQERLREALRIREALGHTREMAIDHDHLGNIDLSQGRHEDAVSHYEKSLQLFDKLEHRGGVALVANNLGLARMHRGEYDLAAACFQRSRALYTEMGDERRLAWCVGNLGLLTAYRGRVEDAGSLLGESLERMEKVGDQLGRATLLNNLALVFRMVGNLDAAVDASRRAIETMNALGLVEGSASPWTNLSLAELEKGDLQAAREAASRVSELTGSSRSPGTRCDALILRATIALHEQDHATTLALAREAQTLAERSGQPRERAEALRLQGEALLRTGNTQGARTTLLAAQAASRNLGDAFQSALCRLLLGDLFLSVESVEAAGRHLRQSAETFREIGNQRLRWRALILLVRAEWPLSRERALTTLALTREMARDAQRDDWALEVSRVESQLRSEGEPALAAEGSLQELAEICRLVRAAPSLDAVVATVITQVSRRHSLDVVAVARNQAALEGGASRDPEIDRDLALLAQAAWASGQPQYAWPGVVSEADGEVPFVVAVPISGAADTIYGVLLIRGVEDAAPASPRPPRLWWFLRTIGEILSLSIVARDPACRPDGDSRLRSAQDPGPTPEALPSRGNEPVTPDYADLVGRSPLMRSLYEAIERVAPTGSTVLIQGESGTGKELVARALHAGSSRAAGPFVAISCPSIPRELLEAELFGYEKGAFTGAAARKEGQVLLADHGTLFLDEIGDIDIPTQTKLLRFLQEREFIPIGGRQPVRVDLRLVAATSRNLEEEVRAGRFREDLFYRLSVVPLRLAPLRDRAEDVPRLVRFFLDRITEKQGRARMAITPGALACLGRHAWPGNVRELRNVVEFLVAFGQDGPIQVNHLPEKIRRSAEEPVGSGGTPVDLMPPARGSGDAGGGVADSPLRAGETLESRVMSVEGSLIRDTLQRCGGNQSRAARLLGLKESTMRNKMRRYGISGATQRSPRRSSTRTRSRGGQSR